MAIVVDARSGGRWRTAEEALAELIEARGGAGRLHVSAVRHAGGDWTVAVFDQATGREIEDPELGDAIRATLDALPAAARR
jgi:hypothetical protein